MDARFGDAPRHERGRQISEESSGSAQVEVCLLRHAQLLQGSDVKMAERVAVQSYPIIRPWPAVRHIGAAVGQLRKKISRLAGERVLSAIACAMEPPELMVTIG